MSEEARERARWRVAVDLVRPHRRRLILVSILALLATATDLASPMIYREAVNDVAGLFVGTPGATGIDSLRASAQGRADPAARHVRAQHQRGRVAARTPDEAFETLAWAVLLYFAINVFSRACSLAADQRTVVLASRIEADVIQRTFRHVLDLPLGFFNRRASGGLAKQVDQSDKVAPIVSAIAHDFFPEIVRMLGVMAIMFTQSWKLSLVALVTLPPYAWLAIAASNRLDSGMAKYFEMWDAASGRIQDVLGAVKTVKLSGAEASEHERLKATSDAAYATYVERNRLANFYVFWQTTLSYLSQALVLGYGGFLVFEHLLTPGDVVMFVVYLDTLYAPVESLTGLSVTLQEDFASLHRALLLQAMPTEVKSGRALAPGPGRVEFRDVHFGYDLQRQVLCGISFVLEAGKVTALVGPSGAGKTTIADLLLRLFEPTQGAILIDGQDLRTIDPAAARREIGVVAADGALFRGTLLANICYKRPDAPPEEAHAAALAAGLGATLERLPDGLATEVGERGVGLSVGERQRIQIARAIVGRPRVLVLDEATANLDYATEAQIRAALLEGAARPTTLVIAHRFSMVEGSDHVIVLEAGRVVDQGTPAELIARGGWFARFAAGNTAHADARVEDGADAEDDDEPGAEDGGELASSEAEDRFPE